MIKTKLKEDSVTALKAHDSLRVEVVRFLISLIDKKELQLPPGEMKEEDEVGVLRKELKNKEESLAMFEKASRADLVERLKYEIEVLKTYLPKEMDESEVRKIVSEVVGEMGINNRGMIIGAVIKKTGGRVGGDVVSRLVSEVISEK